MHSGGGARATQVSARCSGSIAITKRRSEWVGWGMRFLGREALSRETQVCVCVCVCVCLSSSGLKERVCGRHQHKLALYAFPRVQMVLRLPAPSSC